MRKPPKVDERSLELFRYFLKDSIRDEIDFSHTEQARGLPAPPIEKPFAATARRIALPGADAFDGLGRVAVVDALRRRQSVRHFIEKPLSLTELAFLLWATQGVRRQLGKGTVFRTVPSAGNRHPFETYLYVRAVEGVEAGIYRYLPLEHELLFEFDGAGLSEAVTTACRGQAFAGQAAATFVWTVIPRRTEWRYGQAAHKVMALDAGHVCQNLYLACEAIDAGTCAVAAYDQAAMDALLRVDGEEEFTIYLAPVGKVR
jgi:SagB-type dehydrogenase family enzyme